MTRLTETRWHDQPAWLLESEQLRVITVPGMGAKIVSIFNKAAEFEWLLGPGERPFRPVPYGASFVEQDMSGWDEMFPTIVAGEYPADGPYAGRLLPDHGEVWAIPWDIVDTSATMLTTQVRGRALPYRLARTMSLPDADTLRLDYTVENTGDVPLLGFWTAHPQFTATPATEIRLPEAVGTVLVVHFSDDLIPPETSLDWPLAVSPDGRQINLSRVESAWAQRSRKVYLMPDQPVGWAELVQTDANHWLRLEWDAAQVRYLGIWVDEGDFNPDMTIALEPSTGFYDSLSLAHANNRVPVLGPGEIAEWSISVALGMAAFA